MSERSKVRRQQLNQSDAALTARGLADPAIVLSGRGLAISKYIAAAHFPELRHAQGLLSRPWWSVAFEDVIARQLLKFLVVDLLCSLDLRDITKHNVAWTTRRLFAESREGQLANSISFGSSEDEKT